MPRMPDGYKRVGETTLLTDDAIYAVIVNYKDDDGEPHVKERGGAPGGGFEKVTGTYDECADYCERNNSPDNIEVYHVAEKVT
jgi:hypothetical protein